MNDFKSAPSAEQNFARLHGANNIPMRTDASLTLRDVFLDRCRTLNSKLAFVELGGDLDIRGQLTYGQLEHNVLCLARTLSAYLQPGSTILLALDGGLGSVELFWAAILADLVPIPAPAADASIFRETAFQRLKTIERHARAGLVVAEARDLARPGEPIPANWISLDALRAEAARDDRPALRPQSTNLAYLQYTSGSTSEPRGVEISHANALAQCAGLMGALDTRKPNPSLLTWLPWFHDFGLVQGVLLPIYGAGTSYLMPTGAFIRRPLRWLEAISRFNIIYSGAPNTAYMACVRALARHPQWQAKLDNWSVAICGAEPVRPDTYQAFVEAFGPHGFRKESFFPSYGLAECVLGVTTKPAGTAPLIVDVDADALERNEVRAADEETSQARSLISCGVPLDCCAVKIVDPETALEQAPSRIGEIWVRGPSVSGAYHLAIEPTRATFGARLADSSGAFTYLRTGDLGAMHEGQLVVTGRLKDLIVVNGRNLYPQDLELTVEKAHAEVREGGVVAFSIDSPSGEALVILAESIGALAEAETNALIDAVVTRVGTDHGVDIHDIVVLRRGSLQHTSSGKPQRSAAKQRYLAGELEGLRLSTRQLGTARLPRNATELIIADAWMDVLGLPEADIDASFFLVGGNSLHATKLASRLGAAFGFEVPIQAVFEAPTIAGIAEAVARMRPSVPAHARRLPETYTSKVAHRLSFSQERIWFIEQEAPESSAYHMPLAIRLRGELDADALEAAIQDVIERHAVLRTIFASDAYGVSGHVHDDMPVKLHRKALPAFNKRRSDDALSQLLARLTQQPFDFANGPLIRADLIDLHRDESVLLIVAHHLVGDQWSFAIMMQEIAHNYRRRTGGGVDALPPLGLQYADYAAWQRATFETDRRPSEEAYWREQLKDLDPATLPTDFPQKDRAQATQGARIRFDLPAEMVRDLTAIGAQHSASLAMVLMAALKALLHRTTGGNDVVIGLPVANRHHASSEKLIGSFVNLLALRTQVRGEASFPQLLKLVRTIALDAFAHQDMPYELVVHMLRQQRGTGRLPLFQVLFNMINTPLGDLDFGGVELSRVEFDRKAAQFDLSITVDPTYDRSITLEYAVDLFDVRTIEQFGERYLRFLQRIVDGETSDISDWPMMADKERDRMLEWGRGASLTLPHESVAEWLGVSFDRHRNNTAIVFNDERMTYEQLDGQSAAVAKALNARGIGTGQRVGFCAARSLELLIAQVGIIRAGAAYVPLEPGNPQARLKIIADNADLALILTDARSGTALAEIAGAPQLSITALLADGPRNDAAAMSTASAEDAAYVLYTSGSTGKPKGVSVTHRSVVNLMASIARTPGFDSTDRILAITPLGFDISVCETLLPLATGAQVVLAGSDDVTDGGALARLIEKHAVTVLQATPATWEILLRSGWNGSPSLQRALVTGEALSPRLAKALLTRCPEVWNLYGPTETTVWSTLDRVEDPDARGISIGAPIHNTQVYVLDHRNRICPVGVEGELYIGGDGVSRGYFGQPDLTAERFVPDAYTGAPRRLYRSGDIVRWQADGKLQFLRRADEQLKLRGFRIEPGEIENAMASHPQVSQAAVVAVATMDGEMALITYLVPRDSAPSEESARAHLRRLLPPHMLPQHIVTVDALPLLSSGKLDRKALGTLPGRTLPPAEPAIPASAAEQSMLELWRDVLENDTLGVEDNFFDLGGHSMLALRLIGRIAAELDPRCTPPMLFQYPTVKSLCAALRNVDEALRPSLVTLQPNGTLPPLFCICGINIYRALAEQFAPDRPVYGMFVPSELQTLADPEAVQVTHLGVETIAAEYLSNLRARQPHGPYHLLGVSFGGLLAFEIAQQLKAAGEEVGLLVMLDTMRPEGRAEALARRAVRSVSMLRSEGFISGATHLRHRFAELVRTQHPAGATAAMDIEDERRIAARDSIYMRAMMQYAVQPYDGKTVLFHAVGNNMPDSTARWRTVIGDLDIVPVSTDHLGLLKAPHAAAVAGAIRDALQILDDRRSGLGMN